MAGVRTGYLFDSRFLGHDTGEERVRLPAGGELEPVEQSSAVRITRRTHALIEGSGLYSDLTLLDTREATIEDLAMYHTYEHIDYVRQVCASGGGDVAHEADDSTPVAPASWPAALLAAGGGMVAVDAVVQGRVSNAYALLRPPGHHAMANAAMGFCLFNNVVIAARHARRNHGLERILIVDWDVHHGNGTQSAFYDDPDTLFMSLHQDDWYPKDWGKVDDVGGESAAGLTVNIPLPPGTGDQGYLEAFDRVIRPISQQFCPELILISAGQDPSMKDPLGRMMVTMDGFRRMAATMLEIANECCNGRIVGLQEGGYSVEYVPFCTLAVVEAMLGARSSLADCYAGGSELDRAKRTYRPEQSEAITAVISAQRRFWRL